jgi:aspartate carbamoyltransferase catalytic subunit
MFTGDTYHSRTINSLVRIISTYQSCNAEFIFTNEINPILKEFPHQIIKEKEIPDHIDSVNVLYMTRPQMERWTEKSTPSNFVLTNELAEKMKKDAIIMHPLPRNNELLPEVDQNHRAKYFEQMKNGVNIRMAILYWLL